MVLIMVISFALMVSGCPKKQTTPSEEKKPEVVSTPEKPPQESPPAPPAAAPPPPPPPETPKPPSPPQEPVQGPLASGSVLLNLSNPQDAKIAQARLSELGLYKAAIDGIWGKLSRAALKAFKEQNGLPNPEKWDKETQMLLFRGTDK